MTRARRRHRNRAVQEGAAQPRAAVDVRGLVKRFGLAVALDGIDLRIDAGESMALFGPQRRRQDDARALPRFVVASVGG